MVYGSTKPTTHSGAVGAYCAITANEKTIVKISGRMYFMVLDSKEKVSSSDARIIPHKRKSRKFLLAANLLLLLF